MKKQHYFLILFTFLFFSDIRAQSLKPYILGVKSDKTIDALKSVLKSNLEAEGLDVIGEYAPAKDADRLVMIITSEELLT